VPNLDGYKEAYHMEGILKEESGSSRERISSAMACGYNIGRGHSVRRDLLESCF